MKVAAASTTIPVTNAAMQEYAKISLRTLAICFPRATSPIRAERSLQHRGEKVKFLRIRPLNARKKMMLLTERMTGCLDEGQLHVSKIAWLLSDVSAFTHTRRRWIGKTPEPAANNRRTTRLEPDPISGFASKVVAEARRVTS